MKTKLITPTEKIFQVFALTAFGEDCLVIRADDKEHAEKIARYCWTQDGNEVEVIISNTEIDLIAEDR